MTVLTPRERDVLKLVAQGQSNKDIAQRLVLSEHTVHRHLANILRKLDLSFGPFRPFSSSALAITDRAKGMAAICVQLVKYIWPILLDARCATGATVTRITMVSRMPSGDYCFHATTGAITPARG